jgi:multisubunit Na+/H+ antiporter MnhE subunit
VNVTASSAKKRPLPLRIVGFVLFLYHFFRELVLANFDLASLVLSKKREHIEPGFIEYPVAHLSKLEILILSHCITLTPGSATIEVTPDYSRLVLHILDLRKADAMVRSIREGLEIPLLRWTR